MQRLGLLAIVLVGCGTTLKGGPRVYSLGASEDRVELLDKAQKVCRERALHMSAFNFDISGSSSSDGTRTVTTVHSYGNNQSWSSSQTFYGMATTSIDYTLHFVCSKDPPVTPNYSSLRYSGSTSAETGGYQCLFRDPDCVSRQHERGFSCVDGLGPSICSGRADNCQNGQSYGRPCHVASMAYCYREDDHEKAISGRVCFAESAACEAAVDRAHFTQHCALYTSYAYPPY